jgi:uncharacterized protein YqhQ
VAISSKPSIFRRFFTHANPDGTIFSILKGKPKTIMDLLIIILAFLLAYGIFVLIAVKLARIFFPKVVDDEALNLKSGSARQRHPKRAAA